jgi:hypothetical protein
MAWQALRGSFAMEDCAAILRVGGEAMQPDQRFWAGKWVCVTVGTGFLGWHLVRELLPRAAHVRVLALPARSPYLRLRLAAVEFIAGDIRDADTVRRAIGDCDVVFHAAGPTATWGAVLNDVRAIHVDGTRLASLVFSHPVSAHIQRRSRRRFGTAADTNGIVYI